MSCQKLVKPVIATRNWHYWKASILLLSAMRWAKPKILLQSTKVGRMDLM